MKLTSIADVRSLLDQRQIQPQKSLGQNFLIDANILEILRQIADLRPEDQVLEVGAGLGILTAVLIRAARRVVSVEKDRRLWALLQELFPNVPNLELVCGDMLKLDHAALFASGINKVVANLPYSVGSAILVNFFQAARPPEKIVVTLQQEVAERLAAAPGGRAFGLLSLWGQLTYDIQVRKIISPTCFYPPPNVKSAIVEMVRLDNTPAAAAAERKFFFQLTKFAFTRRRKQLHTVFREPPPAWGLAAGEIAAVFDELGVDSRARPETLAVAQWRELALKLNGSAQKHRTKTF